MSDLAYWIGFNLVKGIGPTRLRALIERCGSVKAAWQANEGQLIQAGLDSRTRRHFLQRRTEIDLHAEIEKLTKKKVKTLTWDSPTYPFLLQQIAAPPPLIYLHGSITEADQTAVAIVGTRRLTGYGRQIAKDLAAGLAANGVTIVSGLARGIDAVAHRAALDAGGRTIAVLGSGFNHIYPPENRKLAQEIVMNKQGAVATEYGLHIEPEAKNFPPRNRLISGLSLGVVVIEAGVKSGALITAKFALEQNRDVMAVPGNVSSPVSRGPNTLIQQGAKLVMGVDDVLEELQVQRVAAQTAVQLALPDTAEEATILAHLSAQPTHIDTLIRECALPSGVVSSTLTMLELKGVVQQTSSMQFVRLREADASYHLSAK